MYYEILYFPLKCIWEAEVKSTIKRSNTSKVHFPKIISFTEYKIGRLVEFYIDDSNREASDSDTIQTREDNGKEMPNCNLPTQKFTFLFFKEMSCFYHFEICAHILFSSSLLFQFK